MPLAAAMRDAYKTYYAYSSPLDSQLKQYLSIAVPINVLNAARFTVGNTPDFTIPGFLNAGYEAAGNGHAVALANVVIFSRYPNMTDCFDFHWVLHELRHVEQYMSYSADALEAIDGFAVNYISSYNSIEDDADNAANAWIRQLGNYYGYNCGY